MKQIIYFAFLFIFLINFFPLTTSADNDPTKYALIIAVANYPEEGHWRDISSDNDISLIKGALTRQGFHNKNIKVIIDDQAKKELIVREFRNLTRNVKPGDIVVIHYSGHGQQIQDDNGDELDGWDESLIPWDAQLKWSESYQGENHLRDDEIRVLTDQLREKLGPEGNVLLIMDACHSGTANRGLAKSRGTAVVFSEPDYKPSGSNDKGNNDDFNATDPEKLAPMVTLSGAGQFELNYEYYDQEKDISYGSLSYAFSRAMANADRETTYRSLFDLIKVSMSTIAPRQSPQIEGDVDMILFAGEVIEPKPYFMVTGWLDEKNVTINTGNLMGIYDSSEIAFYPIGTYKPEEAGPLATGTIIYSLPVESGVLLDKPVDKETISNTWVFVTKQNFGDNNLNIRVDINNNKEIEKELTVRLNEMPKVIIVSENPDLIVEMNNEYTRGNNLQLITADEFRLYNAELIAEETAEKIVDEIVDKINHYMQVNLLKKIEMKDDDLDVSFEIVPVTIKKVGRRYEVDQRLDIENMRNAGNELEFTEKDYFILKVRNDGYKRAYFQIIDIRPNNEVTLLYPSEDDMRPASEFVINIDEEKELGAIFYFEEPYGNEYLKLIATAAPIDLRFIIKSRGADSRGSGEMTPFEQLVRDSYKGTRAGSLTMPPSSATVYTIPIKVVENKSN